MTHPYAQVYRGIAAAFRFDDLAIIHAHTVTRRPPMRLKSGSDEWIAWVVNAISPLIYQCHYLRQPPSVPEEHGVQYLQEMEDTEFARQLSAANRGTGIVERGWTIAGKIGNEYLCERDGIRLRVSGEFLQGGSIEQPGDKISVRFPSERRYALAGFYCSSAGLATTTDVRVYFHVKPEAGARLIGMLTEELGRLGTSYYFKILNHPRQFTRPDSAVLYVNRLELEHAREAVGRIAERLPKAFESSVPALTRRLYPGIAVADEPPDIGGWRPSFGEHRSRILARGLARAAAKSLSDVDAITAMLEDELLREEIDPARPFARGEDSVAAVF